MPKGQNIEPTPLPDVMVKEISATFTASVVAGPTRVDGSSGDGARLPGEGDVVAGLYRLVRRLGEGQFGKVYVADRTDVPEHRVALKIMHRAVYAGRDVERELVMLAAATHPNIVQLKDHGMTDDYVWLTMPLYEGLTLAERMDAGPLSLREAYDIFLPVVRGVQALHERGLRHQDIKPENIYLAELTAQIHPVLLDLGVAVEHNAEFVAGTALFGAPEQLAALGGIQSVDQLSEKMDTYCLATTLLYSLVGEKHFPGALASTPFEIAEAFEEREVKPLRDEALPALTGEPRRKLSEALSRWLQRDPEERASTREMAEEIDVLLEQEREIAAAIERGIARQKASLARVRIYLAMAALVGLGIAAYVYAKRDYLALANELERVEQEGLKSFERLDTCIASHEVTERDAQACVAGRERDQTSHGNAMAAVRAQSNEQETALTRRLTTTNGQLRTCEDDGEKASKAFDAEREELEKTLQDREQTWSEERGQLEKSRDEHQAARKTCEASTGKLTQSRNQCREDLASCISDRDTCMAEPDYPDPTPTPVPTSPPAPTGAPATPGGGAQPPAPPTPDGTPPTSGG
ncbi:MAG: protein kinase [Deltaproteobacteria bacterium]|nr:protein kinase [Deltaproteobacteria bacterium]